MLSSSNLIVCGGLPRSATTFLFTELCNYENVFNSKIKESYLFLRGDKFIDFKINQLNDSKLFLDFTPEYIFDRKALSKILERNINCFFILREFEEYTKSLNKYLSVNNIKNKLLEGVTREQFEDAVTYASNNFLTFHIEDIRSDYLSIVQKLEAEFSINFGRRVRSESFSNSSQEKHYYVKNYLFNLFKNQYKFATSSLFGML